MSCLSSFYVRRLSTVEIDAALRTVSRMRSSKVLDPRRSRLILACSAAACGVLTTVLALTQSGLTALGPVIPLCFATWYVRRDNKRDVSWEVSLKDCQVVAASVDKVGAHIDVWPSHEELFVVNARGRRSTPKRVNEATLRTIAVPAPPPELLLRARSWLDDDTRIDVQLSVLVVGGITNVSSVKLQDGPGFEHVFKPLVG